MARNEGAGTKHLVLCGRPCGVVWLAQQPEESPQMPDASQDTPNPDSGLVAMKKTKQRKENTLLMFASNRIHLRNDGGMKSKSLFSFLLLQKKNRWCGDTL
jgi:hypothetical protein